jgi:hypothetical protein
MIGGARFDNRRPHALTSLKTLDQSGGGGVDGALRLVAPLRPGRPVQPVGGDRASRTIAPDTPGLERRQQQTLPAHELQRQAFACGTGLVLHSQPDQPGEAAFRIHHHVT